jgi:hypothetical protein
MKTLEQTLELFDDLLSMGFDNTRIAVIVRDTPNCSLKEYFGISDGNGSNPVQRGVYVSNLDDRDVIKEKADIHYHVENGEISFFKI